MRQSIGLSPAAATRTRSSPAPGVGRGISPTVKFSAGPYSANVAASKLNPPPPNDQTQWPRPGATLRLGATYGATVHCGAWIFQPAYGASATTKRAQGGPS